MIGAATGFSEGASRLIAGFRLLRAPGVRAFVIIPLLINLLVFSALIWLAGDEFARFIGWMQSWTGGWSAWFAWLAWLFWLLFAVLALLIVFYTFTLVANLIGAPFNGLLAARIARHLGVDLPASANAPFLQQMLTDIGQEFRKLGYFIGWALLLAIVSVILVWIPLIGALVPVLWFAFSAWMLALEYSDYHLANLGMNFVEERRLLRRHRWRALGFGSAATVATLVPIVNFLVMPAAVAAAVELWKNPSDLT